MATPLLYHSCASSSTFSTPLTLPSPISKVSSSVPSGYLFHPTLLGGALSSTLCTLTRRLTKRWGQLSLSPPHSAGYSNGRITAEGEAEDELDEGADDYEVTDDESCLIDVESLEDEAKRAAREYSLLLSRELGIGGYF